MIFKVKMNKKGSKLGDISKIAAQLEIEKKKLESEKKLEQGGEESAAGAKPNEDADEFQSVDEDNDDNSKMV